MNINTSYVFVTFQDAAVNRCNFIFANNSINMNQLVEQINIMYKNKTDKHCNSIWKCLMNFSLVSLFTTVLQHLDCWFGIFITEICCCFFLLHGDIWGKSKLLHWIILQGDSLSYWNSYKLFSLFLVLVNPQYGHQENFETSIWSWNYDFWSSNSNSGLFCFWCCKTINWSLKSK